MGQLQALQEELGKILFVGSKVTSSRFWDGELPKRLQVYKNTVHGNAYDTMDSDFSMTMKQFTDDEWFELEKAYFAKNTPAYWELNQCVMEFPAFLKKQKVKPWVAELAEFEAADLQAFINTAEVKPHLGRSNPSIGIRVFQHQIYDWALTKGDPKIKPAQKPEVVVFYRDINHVGYYRKADPLMLMLLDIYSKPGACLHDAEHVRAKLLPGNTVPLENVLNNLIQNDLILL